jgi:AraC-like DNA-binding protein
MDYFPFKEAAMDLLTEVMAQLRTQGESYGCLELAGPFAFRFPVEIGHFLIVTRGACFLDVEDGPLVALSTGDFVFLPTYRPFAVKSSPDLRTARPFTPTEADEYRRTERLVYEGTGGMPVTLLSGCFTFANPESRLLIEHLPPVLLLPKNDLPWDQTLVQLIAHEIAHRGAGFRMAVDRLSEVLFVHTMRDYFDRSCQDWGPSWIRALKDRQVGAALNTIHADPAHPWTVDELADKAAMSRSAFAAKFKAEVGVTPLEHLTRWRMARAARLLGEPHPVKLESIAAQVGYQSESSFRKAFQKTMGVSPARYREKETPQV